MISKLNFTLRSRQAPAPQPVHESRPEHSRHRYEPGVTAQARWAKHLIGTKGGHAR